ncbi:hypothetical protein STEG23_037625, partial [Scotinomys teguina]
QDPRVLAICSIGGIDPATDSGPDAHPGPIPCTSFFGLGNVFGTPHEAVKMSVKVEQTATYSGHLVEATALELLRSLGWLWEWVQRSQTSRKCWEATSGKHFREHTEDVPMRPWYLGNIPKEDPFFCAGAPASVCSEYSWKCAKCPQKLLIADKSPSLRVSLSGNILMDMPGDVFPW